MDEARPLRCVGRVRPSVMLQREDILGSREHLQEPERKALSKILHKQLWDVFRVFESKAGYWSWWDYRGSAWKRNRGWRIDHIYLCQELIDCARSCIIDVAQRGSLKPSDHVPVLLDLDWPPTGPVNGNANTEDLLSL